MKVTATYDIAQNAVSVGKNAGDKPRRNVLVAFGFLAAALGVIASVMMLAYDWYSGRLGLIGPQPVIIESHGVRIIKVPPGGNVQAAIESARGGDVVELQAGATYSGQIDLPNKPITDYVTIRSSAFAALPVDKRVSPGQVASMARITSGLLGRAAVVAESGAHHYRFVGIEFTASNTSYNYGLIRFGSGEKRPENVPHHLEIDRSYIHPHKDGVTRRGIALNSADTTISNSYIEGIAYEGEETQGICGWTGSRNVRIINNYIEGGAENIMFGGSDPANAELIPMDIEIRGNHLNKPAGWKENVTVKTLFELKNAKRVQFTGNILTNNWKGSALRITVRNQDGGAPFSVIEDVTIKNNIISGAGEGINILGSDDTYSSQTLKRLVIENNLFLRLAGGGGYEGSGYFVQIADGEDITIANNTVFNAGNTVTFYGTLPRNIVFRDNIMGHGRYGIHGLADIRSEQARRIFQNNVIVNDQGVERDDRSYPPGNDLISDYRSIGFVDLAQNDLALSGSSKLKNRGSKKTDIGCDTSQLPMDDFRSLTN
jgi:hypothetical protein